MHIGGYDPVTGKAVNGTLQLFNAVIAAPWLAGISLDGPMAWTAYGKGESMIRRTTVTYTLATSSNTFNHEVAPARGYTFCPENTGAQWGFGSSDNTAQAKDFNTYNDTLKLQLATPFVTADDPKMIYDEIGMVGMVLYKNIGSPVMTPASASVLLSGATYANKELQDGFIDKTPVFRGAFGPIDWTHSWTNCTPQQTPYN